jgi:hypothetical protein
MDLLSLMNGRHIIVSHCFSCSKSSKRSLTSYILFILIICGNIELNPGLFHVFSQQMLLFFQIMLSQRV